ncbi:hypothetical protein BK134_02325 [Paenibacillus peoriae]|nr:hypothetical protein BK134_02325 [Paenibacillus peoriae]
MEYRKIKPTFVQGIYIVRTLHNPDCRKQKKTKIHAKQHLILIIILENKNKTTNYTSVSVDYKEKRK